MIVTTITNNDYDTCHECTASYINSSMYKITYERTNKFATQDSWDLLRPTILCKNCLFKLLLKINDIFELMPMLDGSSPFTRIGSFSEHFDCPPAIADKIKQGHRIQAIKIYLDEHGCGLFAAKQQIDKWTLFMIENDLVDWDNYTSMSKKRWIKSIRETVKRQNNHRS